MLRCFSSAVGFYSERLGNKIPSRIPSWCKMEAKRTHTQTSQAKEMEHLNISIYRLTDLSKHQSLKTAGRKGYRIPEQLGQPHAFRKSGPLLVPRSHGYPLAPQGNAQLTCISSFRQEQASSTESLNLTMHQRYLFKPRDSIAKCVTQYASK